MRVIKTYVDNASDRVQQQGMCDRGLCIAGQFDIWMRARAKDRLHSPVGCTSSTVID